MGRFYSKKVIDPVHGEFDSTIEFNYFKVLLKRQALGEISNLERQTEILLQDKFKMPNGESVRKICYKADFTYDENGKYVVVDCKGSIALIEELYKVKLKLMKCKYPSYKYEIILGHKGTFYNIEDKETKKIYKEITKKKKK